ncbi:MAG: VCBS repeat-containing protein [Adhaeribacter sp.]
MTNAACCFSSFFRPTTPALPLLTCAALLLLAGCRENRFPEEKALFETLDSTATHISFVNKIEDQPNFNILDYLYFYNGAGVAAGDLDKDGRTDLFFVSNRGKNKLYLNQGDFTFRDVSAQAGIEGFSDWKTGVTMADVNGDGWLDIYVCAVGNFKGLEGANELYISNGVGADGKLSFSEQAADYGLDFTGFATQAAFFDYDRDGDLDVYLLNHAVHTARSYDRVNARNLRHNEAGDYLLQNPLVGGNGQSRRFADVSEQAGIYGAVMGYGLGISVADFNNDGWQDIYVANDFHEDDYYYLNQGNGTFRESVKEHFRHTSRFSMGCDAADINNDGYADLMTLDMYPADEQVEKSSMGEDPLDIYLYKLQFGYFNQYSRNCLQLNLGGQKFSEVGLMAGVAATDWSWAPLLADYDNDGHKDIFITNGILRRPNNMDYIKFATQDSLLHAPAISKGLNRKAISLMPEGKVHNYLFQGNSRLQFRDRSREWGFGQANISNGAAYADLDNDGDLDLVTNNLNSPAGIYRNQANALFKNHFLRVKLEGKAPNTGGLGARVTVASQGRRQSQQLMPTRGFLSAVEPLLLFGLGKASRIDTLWVVWDNGTTEVQTNLAADQTLVLRQSQAAPAAPARPPAAPLFAELSADLTIPYRHRENDYLDYYRESLMPFQVSTEGPKLAIGDVNGDGLEDVYAGGAKWQAGSLLLQQPGGNFHLSPQPAFLPDSTCEDVGALFFDADGDKDLDLYVVSGGNEFYDQMPELLDRLYLNDGQGRFSRSAGLPAMYANKSCVEAADFDADGDLDLFVGGRVVGYQYGRPPRSYLLVNDGKGKFTDQTARLAPGLQQPGMVTAAQWADLDRDGDPDLVVAGDWMPLLFFENRRGRLTDQTGKTGLSLTRGLWQALRAADFDADGDLDLVAGNLGLNNKFRKTKDSRLKMYVQDLDGNKTLDQVLAYSVGADWYPVATKDELGKQVPMINKKFTSYRQYAGKTLAQLFPGGELQEDQALEVNQFRSLYLENTGSGKFTRHALPQQAQVSKIFAIHAGDLNQDGHLDMLLGGNFYGVSMYQGRYDASYGLLLEGTGKGTFKPLLPSASGLLLEGEVRDIQSLKAPQGELLLVARNKAPLQAFRLAAGKGPGLLVKALQKP